MFVPGGLRTSATSAAMSDTVSHVSGLVGRTELVLVIAVQHQQDSIRGGAMARAGKGKAIAQHIYVLAVRRAAHPTAVARAARGPTARAERADTSTRTRARTQRGAHAPRVVRRARAGCRARMRALCACNAHNKHIYVFAVP